MATSWLATIPPSQYDLVVAKKYESVFFVKFGDEVVVFWAQIQNFLCAKFWLQNHALIAKLCFGRKHHVLSERIVFCCGSKQFKALLFSRVILIGII